MLGWNKCWFLVLPLLGLISLTLVSGGIVTNQSDGAASSVSSSSSSSVSSIDAAQPKTQAPAKKPYRAGKVLYTAPYSTVRKHEGKLGGRSFPSGPILVKARKMTEEDETVPQGPVTVVLVPSSPPTSSGETTDPTTTHTSGEVY